MKTKVKVGLLALGVFAFPFISFAATTLTGIDNLVTDAGTIVNKVIPIMFALALLGFFWGIVQYIFGSEEDKASAKKTMIWGVVALFVMSSIWGLVAWLGTASGVGTGTVPTVGIPKVTS